MGRPKGSKNKVKVQEELPVLTPVKKTAKPLESTEAAKVYIKAAVDLAIAGARNYIVDKVNAWKAGRMGSLVVEPGKDMDTYRLLDDNDDEIDSVTVFHTDVEDVVKGILGLR